MNAAASSQPIFTPSRLFSNLLVGLSLSGELAALTSRGRDVFLAVMVRFNWKRGAAWPSLPDLMARTGLAEETIRRGIKDLELAGFLAPVKVAGKATRYLLPARLRELADQNPWATAGHPPKSEARARPTPLNLRGEHQELSLEPKEEPQQKGASAASFPPLPVEVVVLLEGEPSVPSSCPLPEAEPPPADNAATPIELLPRDLYQELRALGVHRPSALAKHGVQRIREALASLRAAKNVKSPAGWLASCLAGGWLPPTPVRSAPLPVSGPSEALERYEEVRASLAEPEVKRRADLARIRTFAVALHFGEERLRQRLDQAGLSWEEWQAFLLEE